jgi:D-glycero-D-manno-heptose 1,7-bisphosphate phosphatase
VNRAIFFDRDGVLITAPLGKNNKPESVQTLSKINLTVGIIKLCRNLKKKYYLFMITNQPDFARKKNTKKNINQINIFLKNKLNLDDIFVCFCKYDSCKNRKPNPGMLIQAKKKFNINLKKSFFIGDRWRDIDAGKKVGCKTIFIDYKYNEKQPSGWDFKVSSLSILLNTPVFGNNGITSFLLEGLIFDKLLVFNLLLTVKSLILHGSAVRATIVMQLSA